MYFSSNYFTSYNLYKIDLNFSIVSKVCRAFFLLKNENVSGRCIVRFHHRRKKCLFVGCNQRLVAETISAKMKIFLHCYLCTAQKLSFQKVANCFFLRSGFFFSVDRVENKTLALHKVTRSQMGSYLCIATNGYPPAVSKKVQLKVNCKFFSEFEFSRLK